jgi:hypothetical protein
LLFDERMAYFAPEPSAGDWFGQGRYPDTTSKKTSRDLHEHLCSLGVDYLLWTWHRPQAELPRDEDFEQLFELCLEGPQFSLYRLR